MSRFEKSTSMALELTLHAEQVASTTWGVEEGVDPNAPNAECEVVPNADWGALNVPNGDEAAEAPNGGEDTASAVTEPGVAQFTHSHFSVPMRTFP